LNTNALARRYDALTTRERLSLILAADARHDEVEALRLRQAAPLRLCRVPDHTFPELMLHTLTLIFVSEQLDHVATHWLARGRLGTEDDDAEADWCLVAVLSAYAYTVDLDAFRRFCAERNIDYTAQVKANYHGWLLMLADDNMPAAAPTREEVVRLLRGRGGGRRGAPER
jgi:hypothetical protein